MLTKEEIQRDDRDHIIRMMRKGSSGKAFTNREIGILFGVSKRQVSKMRRDGVLHDFIAKKRTSYEYETEDTKS